MEEAINGFSSVCEPDLSVVELAKAKINHCTGCNQCKEKQKCIYSDDFNEILEQWVATDALLYSCPVYHMSVPSKLKAVIDKLGHVNFSKYGRVLPRFCKVGGILAQGTARFGGQETTIQFLVEHLLTMNCIPVPGDTPGSYIGAPGQSASWERGSIHSDDLGLSVARNLGKRLAEMALIIRSGLDSSKSYLPEEYHLDTAQR
jgi:multimeric flavodoxin WrbA